MKKKKPHTSRSCNFRLTGNTSILIGIYIMIGAVITKTLVSDDFESSWLSFIPRENVKYSIAAVLILVLFTSLLTLFLKAKENVNELGFILWNETTKKSVWQIVILFLFGFIVANKLYNLNYEDMVTPMFLFGYGILVSLLNYTKYKSLYLFALICSLIGVVAFFFPAY
ncbi:hypothetical protein, partial [Bizionia sp.]